MSEEQQLMQLWSEQENKVSGRYATADDIFQLMQRMVKPGTPVPTITMLPKDPSSLNLEEGSTLGDIHADFYSPNKEVGAAYFNGGMFFPDNLRMNEEGMYAITHELMHYFDDLAAGDLGDQVYYSDEIYSQNPMDQAVSEWDNLTFEEQNKRMRYDGDREYWSEHYDEPHSMEDFFRHAGTKVGQHPSGFRKMIDSRYHMTPTEIMAFSTAPTSYAFGKGLYDWNTMMAADHIIKDVGYDHTGEAGGELAPPRDPKIKTQTFLEEASLWDGIKELFGAAPRTYEESFVEEPGVRSSFDITDLVQYINTIKNVQEAGAYVTSDYLTPFGESLYDFTKDEVSTKKDFYDAYDREKYLRSLQMRGGLED